MEYPPQARPAKAIPQVEGSGTAVTVTNDCVPLEGR
jgi:hypothetical protein